MKDVDQMFQDVVDPWWAGNCRRDAPDFSGLRNGIASYSSLCRHAAWNDVGRWFIRGKDGSEKRELVGLQCLVQALLSLPTNDSAAWTAFSESTRPELASVQNKLAGLPRRPEPHDEENNRPLAEELERILGQPGAA
jgi:hypothetical protein